ncbi:hypothetical protein J1N35_037575 [Gossypium stocksii]|uniref:Uncharacterized protein n=1 Tax=Gossypium stocksii TaxID=47602 RepID=A0A9D3UJX8_9ROSI|nr:hypothetical protein J1N35_037575 [Gossypium stocksii]
MQTIKTDIRRVQAMCGQIESQMNNLYDQMSQLMTMFQKQNGQNLPSNMENNPQRVGKKHLKVTML